MKANEAPDKIYCGNNGHGNLSYSNQLFPNAVEYTRTDAFIEKADKFISSFFHPDDTDLKKVILDEFHKYMEGE